MWPLLRSAPIVLLALACSVGYPVPAMSQSSVLAQKSTDADEIAAIAQRDGKVRIIVMFQPPAGVSLLDPNSVAAAKSQVAATQDAIIARHFGNASNPTAGHGFQRNVSRFSLTPGFAVNVSAAELQNLASDPQVTQINYDRAVPLAR